MQHALEGSLAIARAVSLCRPQVVSAYPITPQTHIVENLSKLVADGVLDCELVSVESEFSAASVALGAVAAGSRAYTASSSQGILLMSEVLFNIAGLRVPLVLTCANRAVSAPLSIWNDQQDSMAVRDAGWIQLYCADNQEAVDTTIQAFRIAEQCELPVMVCVDGFTLTHTLEVLDMPDQQQVDDFLPAFSFARRLDPANPLSVGTLVSPEFFTETRHDHHQALLDSADAIVQAQRDWLEISGRDTGGLLRCEGPEHATTGILTLGSIAGTLQEAIEEHGGGTPARLITLRAFRPFPEQVLRDACRGLERLIVVERALSPGAGGIVGTEVRAALGAMQKPPQVFNFAVGLGGRDVPLEIYSHLLEAVDRGRGVGFDILDLDTGKLPAEAS
ncbi:MAG: transketolase C-terminal domain-containing protein [Gammaproteobacteria bacterium]|nr:MAG: transketolase C-terminal domain-containing protein [Gammaproteobacteria bacterium]